MKILTSLIAGGALTLGTVMAQDAPKPAASTAPAAQNQTTPKAKKHRKHKKGAANKTTKPATPAATTSNVTPNNIAPKK
jgi:hypothetical protein